MSVAQHSVPQEHRDDMDLILRHGFAFLVPAVGQVRWEVPLFLVE
jgi:hypothetical protein